MVLYHSGVNRWREGISVIVSSIIESSGSVAEQSDS
jgi:hypothetical protein